jgi:hypothetical protein
VLFLEAHLQNDNLHTLSQNKDEQKNTCYVLAYIGRASAVLLCFNGIPFVVLLQDTY